MITLTLKFKTQEEADYVYGQLTDGWGENEVDLGPARGPKSARVATCIPIGDAWEHAKGREARRQERLRGHTQHAVMIDDANFFSGRRR